MWATLVPFEGFSISLSCGVSSITPPPPLPPSPLKILLIIISPQTPLLLKLLLLLPPPPPPLNTPPLLLDDSVALASLFVPLLVSFATRSLFSLLYATIINIFFLPFLFLLILKSL